MPLVEAAGCAKHTAGTWSFHLLKFQVESSEGYLHGAARMGVQGLEQCWVLQAASCHARP